jgi:hypothetical protein
VTKVTHDIIKLTYFYLNQKNIDIMKPNMGSTDKIIRIIIAIVIATLFLTHVISGTLGIILLVLAGIFVLTSFISFCPLYLPFGISTRKKEK